MRIDEDDVRQVLALFDKEDIPYINFEYLLNNKIIENNNIKRISKSKVRVKKIGGTNDRSRE